MRKSQKNHPCVLSPDGFKQALQKYAARHAKGDAVFALLSLRLDLEGIATDETLVGASSVVTELLSQSCIASLRQQDRICLAQDGLILFLLPDADEIGAQVASDRISGILREFKTTHRGQELRVGGTVAAANCTQESCDIGGMLQQIGAPLNDHGLPGETASVTLQAELACVDVWGARYPGFAGESIDQLVDEWSGRVVRIQRLDTRAGASGRDDRIKRCRILQNIDHPALNRVVDFTEDSTNDLLFLVWSVNGAVGACRAGEGALTPQTAMNWLDDVVSALSYLQGLVPSVVPDSVNLEDFNQSADGSRLVYSPRLCRFIQSDGKSANAAELFADLARLFERVCVLTGGGGLPAEVNELITQLRQKKVPSHLSSMHKVRAALRKIIDRTHARQSVAEHA